MRARCFPWVDSGSKEYNFLFLIEPEWSAVTVELCIREHAL